MDHLAADKIEIFLPFLECNTIHRFRSNDHHTALNEVEHHIYQFWHVSVFINLIEIDIVIFNNLKLAVLCVTRNKTPSFKSAIIVPFQHVCIQVVLEFEKLNCSRAAGDQDLASKHEHVT